MKAAYRAVESVIVGGATSVTVAMAAINTLSNVAASYANELATDAEKDIESNILTRDEDRRKRYASYYLAIEEYKDQEIPGLILEHRAKKK
jgi:hypothetical protein